jgi:hypothetical protein
MSAFDKIMFINAIGVDSAMFGNEMHFISFVAILSSRNATEGTNFDIQNTVNASIKVFGYRLDRGGATGGEGGTPPLVSKSANYYLSRQHWIG